MLGILFRLASWSSLKTIGNSYISVVTILVPVFGYLVFSTNLGLVAASKAADYITSWGIDMRSFETSSLIKLKLSYVGLSLVGYSTILFQIFCPPPIQKYDDERDFVLKSISVSHVDDLERLSSEIKRGVWYQHWVDKSQAPELFIKSTYQGASPSMTARTKTVDGKMETLARSPWLEQNLDQLNKGYATSYQRSDFSRLILRLPIFFGFLIGYGVAVTPSLQMLGPYLSEVFYYFIP